MPSYYLRYFWAHDAVVEEERGQQTRAQAVAEIERQLLAMYADPALDTKPDLLTHRGGAFYSEAAVALLASLVTDAGDRQVVNVRNHGTLPFLADEAVIEVSRDDRRRRRRAGTGRAGEPADERADRARVGLRGTRGGRRAARRPGPGAAALLAHPLIGQFDLAGRADRPAAGGERRVPAVGQVSAAVGALAAVLAIDGGNSKTDVALIGADGQRARRGARRAVQPPDHRRRPGLRPCWSSWCARPPGRPGLPAVGQVAAHTSACLAGADLPVEEADLGALVAVLRLVAEQLGGQRHVRGAAGRACD